jgi:hypothetical protein
MAHDQDRQNNEMHRLALVYDSTPVAVLGLPEPARGQCRSKPLAPIDRLIPKSDSRRRHPLLKQRTYTSPYLIVRQAGRVEPHRHDELPKLRERARIVNVDHRAAVYGYLKTRSRLVRALLRRHLLEGESVTDTGSLCRWSTTSAFIDSFGRAMGQTLDAYRDLAAADRRRHLARRQSG